MQIKIFEMLPGSSQLALRLCCKQLKWGIDKFVGLKIRVDDVNDIPKNHEKSCENFDWIQHVVIRKLTLSNNNKTMKPNSSGTWFLIKPLTRKIGKSVESDG